ncbi:phosphotransferase [Microbacterium sp. X-17]|uniref:aminoglycoside phosphotransferase family protein n=1 Tax=Microbacterium sp. X-17 TaxID=3144404 RepID=UPI0031F49D05
MEELLAGGNTTDGVVKAGQTVRRPRGHRSTFASEVLRTLNTAGVAWAPTYLGIDAEGRDTFSYIPGATTDHPSQRDERCYAAFGGILRELHEFSRGIPLASGAECLVHGDPGPFNVVMSEGMPVALIDWDSVHPGDPMEDVGYAGWTWCIYAVGNVPVVDQARRLRLFADGYDPELSAGVLLEAIFQCQDSIIRIEGENAGDERLSDQRRQHARAAAEWASSCREVLSTHLQIFAEALHRD